MIEYEYTDLPVFPLSSSRASGFFFWGMRDDPVQYASDMFKHFCMFKIITSSANWDMCTMSKEAHDMNSA